MYHLPALTLVVGGASSGKSDFAEQLVISAGRPKLYIATAQAFDAEMAAKIAKHQQARAEDGWATIEEPTALAQALSAQPPDGVVLVDCATLWLTNLIMAEADIASETDTLLAALADAACPVIVVSNETGQGIVPENRMARAFRQHQGLLNRRLAAQAGLVVQVTVGLPHALKGTLPEGAAA